MPRMTEPALHTGSGGASPGSAPQVVIFPCVSHYELMKTSWSPDSVRESSFPHSPRTGTDGNFLSDSEWRNKSIFCGTGGGGPLRPVGPSADVFPEAPNPRMSFPRAHIGIGRLGSLGTMNFCRYFSLIWNFRQQIGSFSSL